MNEQEINELGKKIIRIIESERQRLKGDPNIIGFGFGDKRTKSKIVPGISIQYIVRTKLANVDDIVRLGSTIISSEIEGIQTDVIKHETSFPCINEDIGAPTGRRNLDKEDPLVGGTSVAVLSDWHSFPTAYGTLGGICFDATTGEALALSNAHVLGRDGGKDVIQPWIPLEEYLESVVKLLTCGPAAFILDLKVPSALTLDLAAAAAFVWGLTILADVEDPSRWGQRVSQIPPSGARTQVEKIHVEATIPQSPFAGKAYSSQTKWNYLRETTAGQFTASIEKERKNENVLIAKHVWTEKESYLSSERVRICASIRPNGLHYKSQDFFVVAHCFPKSEPQRIIKRILIPGKCEPPHEKNEICFHGFPAPAKPKDTVQFPLSVDVFHFKSESSSVFDGPWPPNDPNSVTTMQLPKSPLTITLPASAEVRVEAYHRDKPIRADAYDLFDHLIATATSGTQQDVLHTIKLRGPKIVRIDLTTEDGEGYIVGICVKRDLDMQIDEHNKLEGAIGLPIFNYTGYFDLGLQEKTDKWGILLSVQSVNNAPPGTDPIIAAQNIGGITMSDSIAAFGGIANPGGCVAVMALDHIFDVI